MRDRKASGLRRHQNAGENTSGAHRNVARDVYRPPETLSGLRTTVENPWRFVLACLVSSSKSDNTDSPPRVKVLDIILMESTGGGHPEDFFLTASDGSVQRKSERFLRQAWLRCSCSLSSLPLSLVETHVYGTAT